MIICKYDAGRVSGRQPANIVNDGNHDVRECLRILVNQKFRWAPELRKPRSTQSQLPKDRLRSGGLVQFTQPAAAVYALCGACLLHAQDPMAAIWNSGPKMPDRIVDLNKTRIRHILFAFFPHTESEHSN